ncbi:MAG: elongation factor P maturation arginine rhamnosyltransferase EarP [Rhodocyclaceae bacterium]|nr:elongation factor P maturation arginine rhamnosyltransferase EarP [Rhodocyclaceae bacterium]
MRWDIFCRVVDNFGDIGVCWRLARQLVHAHGRWVRLWVDDWASLRRIVPACPPAPQGCVCDGVEIVPWDAADATMADAGCVIEAFACHLPPAYLAALRARPVPPVWLNLEYLSAEGWIEDCHGVASPDPANGIPKVFFFPGFTERSGGLIREAEVFARRDAAQGIDGRALWLARHPSPGASAASRWVSLFCYANPALPSLIEAWSHSATPVVAWVPEGIALDAVSAVLGGSALVPGDSRRHGSLSLRALPFLSFEDYDALLALCDINFVRGEDSFVRAQWAARPFVWQAYPQAEDVHLGKMSAFLARYGESMEVDDRATVDHLWQAWNTGGDCGAAWSAFASHSDPLRRHARQWCATLARQQDLAGRLVDFVDRVVE